MIQNWVILTPFIYIILFIIGIILNNKFDWGLKDTIFGIIVSIIFFLCIIWFIIATIDFYSSIKTEAIEFATRQIEYQTITNILKTSNDIVKTDIYIKALEYNSIIIQTQTAINNPNYSIMSHFLKCDWASLPLIILN